MSPAVGMSRNKSGAKIPLKDSCQTPGYAFDVIADYIPAGSVIWEPAAGEGVLVRKMRKEGFEVVDTEWDTSKGKRRLMTTRQLNFLNPAPSKDFGEGITLNRFVTHSGIDVQVTNPPFSKKYQWLEQSYKIGIPFFLLVPVETLGAARAQRLFKKHGITFMFLDKRINFKMPNKGWGGSATFPVLWLWWDGANTGKQRVIYLDVRYTEPE